MYIYIYVQEYILYIDEKQRIPLGCATMLKAQTKRDEVIYEKFSTALLNAIFLPIFLYNTHFPFYITQRSFTIFGRFELLEVCIHTFCEKHGNIKVYIKMNIVSKYRIVKYIKMYIKYRFLFSEGKIYYIFHQVH